MTCGKEYISAFYVLTIMVDTCTLALACETSFSEEGEWLEEGTRRHSSRTRRASAVDPRRHHDT